MIDIVKSVNNVPIRMTQERWFHIVENHDEMAGYCDEVLNTVEEADYVIEGYREALIALKKMNKKFLAVIYKELGADDGFIITAYFTSKIKLEREKIVWQKKSQAEKQ